MSSLSFSAFALWHLGYADQALKRSHAAVTLAQEISHPYSVAYALSNAAWLHQLRWEAHAVQEQAEANIALATENGFAMELGCAMMLRGWALVVQGQGKEGIAQLRQGLAAYQATGAELWQPYLLAVLIEAYTKVGQTEEGLGVLTEALALVEKTGERYYEAELYRLKGELLLAQAGSRLQALGYREKTQEVEECFHTAIEIARCQQAKSLELRAAMSLAKLWQQQDKKKQARKMLTNIYGWFTEGFDTKDLREARTLLDA